MVDFSSERKLCMEPTDFSALVQHVLLMVRHELTRGSVNVEIEFEKNLPMVMIDSAKFEQILVNLFINSLHAMRDTPEPKLEVLIYTDTLENVERDEGARTVHHLPHRRRRSHLGGQGQTEPVSLRKTFQRSSILSSRPRPPVRALASASPWSARLSNFMAAKLRSPTGSTAVRKCASP